MAHRSSNWHLALVYGEARPDRPALIQLRCDATTTIGRESGAVDAVLDSTAYPLLISRQHCVITVDELQVVLQDCSLNGCSVDGIVQQRSVLTEGCKVTLGSRGSDYEFVYALQREPMSVDGPDAAAAGGAAAGAGGVFTVPGHLASHTPDGRLEIVEVIVSPAPAEQQPRDRRQLAVRLDGETVMLTRDGATVFTFEARGERPGTRRLVVLPELATALQRACAPPPNPLVGRLLELHCPRCEGCRCAATVHEIVDATTVVIIAHRHRDLGFGVNALRVPLDEATRAADGGPALRLSDEQAVLAHGLSRQEADDFAKRKPKQPAAAAAPKPPPAAASNGQSKRPRKAARA